MKYWLKNGFALIVSGIVLIGVPATSHAATQCKKAYNDASHVGTAITAIQKGVNLYVKSLEGTRDAMLEVLDTAETVKLIDELAKEISHASKDAANVTEPAGSVSEVFNELYEVTSHADQSVLHPLHEELASILKDLALKEDYDAVNEQLASAKELQKEIGYVSTASSTITYGIGAVCLHNAYEKANQQCKTRVENEVNAWAQSLEKEALGIKAVGDAFAEIDKVLASLNVIFTPIIKIKKPIEKMHKTTLKMHHEMKKFEHLLKHKIRIKFRRITLVHTSAHHVLKEWNKTVHRVEKKLHITEIKKLLNHEMNKLMHPVTKAIKHEVKHLEKSIKVDGFSLSSAKAEMAKLKSGFSKLGGTNLGKEAQSIETKVKEVRKLCNV